METIRVASVHMSSQTDLCDFTLYEAKFSGLEEYGENSDPLAQCGWALCCSQMTDNTLPDMASFIQFSFLSPINLKGMQL